MSRATGPDIPDARKNSTDEPPSRAIALSCGRIVVLAFLLAAALSWRKWAEPVIDFGLQLYLPWKISTGSVLYRDVMYLTAGPLSQYYHALLFKCFGVSYTTIICSNLVLTAGMLFLLQRKFRAATNIWTATMISLAIVLVFAFNQYGDIGNYNYISPYCHEVVHGVFLSILAIVFLSNWLARERLGSAMAAGVCTGLVFLTKPEVFLAASVTAVAGFVMVLLKGSRWLDVARPLTPALSPDEGEGERQAASRLRNVTHKPMPSGSLAPSGGEGRGEGVTPTGAATTATKSHKKNLFKFVLKSLAAFILCAALPFLTFTLYFHQSEDWQAALRSAGFTWVPLLHGGVSGGAYYRWCLGLDTPSLHILATLKQFGVIIIVLAAFAFVFRRKMNSSTNRLLAIGAMGAVLAAASRFDWINCGYTFALFDLIFVGLLCFNYRNLAREKPPAFLLLWGVFGLVLTAKLGVFCRVWHYGFILAMPACVSTICLLLWLLPKLLRRFGVHAGYFRVAIGLVLLLGCARLFVQSQFTYRDKTVALGEGGDQFFTSIAKVNPAGEALQAALPWLEKNTPVDATLAVLPEGAMVNYLSRRTNPTRYLVWNPVEFAMFGQETMTAAFRQAAPDYIMLIHRDAAEYGAKYFGQQPEFGRDLMQWIQANYDTVQLIGNEPLQGAKFGIKILKRRY